MIQGIQAFDESQWAKARQILLFELLLKCDSESIPGLLLLRAVKRVRPSLFDFTDPTEDILLARAKAVPFDKRMRDEALIDSLLNNQTTTTTGEEEEEEEELMMMRMMSESPTTKMIKGLIAYNITRDFKEAFKWYQLSTTNPVSHNNH